MRFVGSFLGASVVVGVLLSVGVRLFGLFDQADPAMVFHDVDLLSAAQQQELADTLGLDPRSAVLPLLADIPPLEFQRRVQGFVQLELTVGVAGQVSDVKVLGSSLPPLYHQRAIEIVRGRRYTPDLVDGQPAVSRRLEIVALRMDAPGSTADVALQASGE